jgi:hypothetical protein
MAHGESKVVVLDESHQHKHHPILSVGGFVIAEKDILVVEASWRQAKTETGLDPDRAVRFSRSWDEPSQRAELFCRMGDLPIAAVVAMLEDFRPRFMKRLKETRGDAYIQASSFEYVLQRMVGVQYVTAGGGPHLVAIDRRSDPERFHKVYADHYRTGWTFGTRHLPSLSEYGFAETLLTCDRGALHEIADFLVSGLTGWVAGRCAALKGEGPTDLAERNEMCRAVVGLLPSRGVPPSWAGWSIIAHKGDASGKQLITANIDGWLRGVSEPVAG